jgi:hypothetical protein
MPSGPLLSIDIDVEFAVILSLQGNNEVQVLGIFCVVQGRTSANA